MKIKANGISMNYELAGKGLCITLVHGGGDNMLAWENQVPVFSKKYRVLTYDVRGLGKTELPPGELTAELWVEDLYTLLKALKINETVLVGHSMGGATVLAFTLAHPEMVKALILSNGAGSAIKRSEAEMAQMAEQRQARIEAVKKNGLAPEVNDMIARMFSPGFAEKNPKIIAHYKQIMLQNTPEGYARVLQRMGKQGTPPDFSKIKCPSLVIGGTYDMGGTAGAEASAKAIRGAILKVFPTGHLPQWEVPDEYNKTVLQFLEEAGL